MKKLICLIAGMLNVFYQTSIAAPSFDYQNAKLSQQDVSLNKTYSKLKKVLLLNNEKKSYDKLLVSESKWLQQRNQCKDARCLKTLYQAQKEELVSNWLSGGHGALTYTDAMEMSAPFEKALQQKNVQPLMTHLHFPIVIRYGDLDQFFVTKKEFEKYFPSVIHELSDDHQWQLGVSELGAGQNAEKPIITLGNLGTHSSVYQFISGANDVIAIPGNKELPDDLKKLAKEHETLFNPASITGTYISGNGTMYVRQLSGKETQIVLSLVEDSVGMFSGISRDSSKGKMEFIATNSQFQNPNGTPPAGCTLSAVFSAHKVIIDAGSCDKSGFLGQNMNAAGSYLRVSANEPTPGQMSISD